MRLAPAGVSDNSRAPLSVKTLGTVMAPVAGTDHVYGLDACMLMPLAGVVAGWSAFVMRREKLLAVSEPMAPRSIKGVAEVSLACKVMVRSIGVSFRLA